MVLRGLEEGRRVFSILDDVLGESIGEALEINEGVKPRIPSLLISTLFIARGAKSYVCCIVRYDITKMPFFSRGKSTKKEKIHKK